jgi:2-methylcitrate dehydratase PrpD
MTYSAKLAERYSSLDYGAITHNAIQKAKECLMDYLSCAYAGFSFSSSQIVREFAMENYARGNCTVIGSKRKLVPAGACLVNSTAGHGPELDDVSNEAVIHVGVIIIPVALAMAENLGLGGKDVLRAMVIGYDTDIKIGKAANPATLLARGFHPTAICGMFGAAMTAARLMNLNVQQTVNALGVVGSFVSGNLECYSDGSLTKRLNPGIASSSGVIAAELALKGYTGPKSIFEGPRGFFHSYCENSKPEELDKLNGFEIEKISFKPHACCRFNQAPIDAALAIRTENKVNYKDIKGVLIELPKTGYDIVGQPAEVKFDPKNVVDGQFSAPYSVAIALIEGRAFLDEFTEESIRRPDVHEFLKRITIQHAPDLEKYLPNPFTARVTVTTEDGKIYSKEVIYAKGDLQNPLSWEEILQKFNILVPPSIVSKAKKQKMIETIQDLEELNDIKEFTKLLS